MSIFVRFGIGATIRISREIQCLPYAVFLFVCNCIGVKTSDISSCFPLLAGFSLARFIRQ